MNRKEVKYLTLVSYIENWMESGEPVLTLEFLLAACGGDLNYLQECLAVWQAEGRIAWLKPLDLATPSIDIVRFKTFISKDIAWK